MLNLGDLSVGLRTGPPKLMNPTRLFEENAAWRPQVPTGSIGSRSRAAKVQEPSLIVSASNAIIESEFVAEENWILKL